MSVKYTRDGELYVIEISGKCRLIPIVRTEKETFDKTVTRAQKQAHLTACINGCWFDCSKSTSISAALGFSQPSNATVDEGHALQGNGVITGRVSPLGFYAAQRMDYSWEFGGPKALEKRDFYTGVGGLCPLIINGLKYGMNNKYSKPRPNAALIGEPSKEDKMFLIERSNTKYSVLKATKNETGKAGFGITKNGKTLIIVQAHHLYGTGGGINFNEFRDAFIKHGCINALAVDGSDSVFLNYEGQFLEQAATRKNGSQNMGIGFRGED